MNPTVRAAAKRLAAAGVENPSREAGWLQAALLGVRRADLLGRDLTPVEADLYDAWVARRCSREPLQYIIGTQEFMGVTFAVTPAVLIPRPETEVLVQQALARLEPGSAVADIGTGSGAIAVLMALHGHRVWAVDISAEALAVAEQNAHAAGAPVRFYVGDLLAPLEGLKFDAILSNPPYVAEAELPGLEPEVREYEPRTALVTGTGDPLHFYRRLAAEAPQLLKTNGFLGVEVGTGQAEAVGALLRTAGFTPAAYRDAQGHERTVIAHGYIADRESVRIK